MIRLSELIDIWLKKRGDVGPIGIYDAVQEICTADNVLIAAGERRVALADLRARIGIGGVGYSKAQVACVLDALVGSERRRAPPITNNPSLSQIFDNI